MKQLLPKYAALVTLAALAACQPAGMGPGTGGSKVSEIVFSEPDFGTLKPDWDKMIIRAQKVTSESAGLSLTGHPNGEDSKVTTFNKGTAQEGQPGSATLILDRGSTYAFTVEIQNDGVPLFGTRFDSGSPCPPAVEKLDQEEQQVAPVICSLVNQTAPSVDAAQNPGTGSQDASMGGSSSAMGAPTSTTVVTTGPVPSTTGVTTSPATTIVTAPGAQPVVVDLKPGEPVGKVVGKTLQVKFTTRVVDRKKSTNTPAVVGSSPVGTQDSAPTPAGTPPMPTSMGCFAKQNVEVCFGTDKYVDSKSAANFDFKITNRNSTTQECTLVFQLRQASLPEVFFRAPAIEVPGKDWKRQSFAVLPTTPGVTLSSGAKPDPSKALFTPSSDAAQVVFKVYDILCK